MINEARSLLEAIIPVTTEEQVSKIKNIDRILENTALEDGCYIITNDNSQETVLEGYSEEQQDSAYKRAFDYLIEPSNLNGVVNQEVECPNGMIVKEIGYLARNHNNRAGGFDAISIICVDGGLITMILFDQTRDLFLGNKA